MIIAFGHQKRVGKNTCAKFFETFIRIQYPKLSIKQRSFASPLKLLAHQLYSWAGLKDEIYYENHPEAKEVILPQIGKTPRTIWIELGNHGRQIYGLTWVAKTLAACPEQVTLLTDLRYPNEADYIKNRGGILVRIVRPGLITPTDIADTALNGYTNWDYTVHNDEDLGKLNKLITYMATKLYGTGRLNVIS